MNKLRAILTWGLLSAAAHVMGYSLTVSPTQIEAGQSTNLIINLDDAPNNITAYQMMVYLPEGVTVQKKANGKYAYTANADRHDGAFTVTVRDAADGSVLIACFSADKDVLTGTSGELIRLPLEVASTVTTSLQGNIKNIEFSDVNNNAYNPADVNFTMTLKGGSTPPDVSGDVTVSVPEIEMSAGSTTNLIVNMQTSLTNVTAYQLMAYLPEGVTVQKKANGKYAYTANADRHDGNFTITVKDAADGSVLIACFSADKDVLTGASGELIRLPLEVASTVTTSLQGSIKNIEFSDVNNNAYNPADVNFALTLKEPVSQFITFEDAAVKALCVANWDTNGDGELSEAEAAAVTDLGEVFKSNKGITSFNELQYFTGLTSIGGGAFWGCSGLTSVTIPEGVTSIGQYAFNGCSGLTSITIPNSVTSISDYAFKGCISLTSVTIPESVTSIGRYAFSRCSSLTSITIPESVTSISDATFSGCSSVTSINIPNSVTSIDNNAFRDCSSLTSINIPNSVTSIGNNAFRDCSSLTSINIPNSVTSISDATFSGCSSLTSINIPNSVTSIGNNAFMDCSSLTSINIPNSVTSIGNNAFRDCSSLTSINIPNSVTSIDSYAFSDCSGLTSIIIPNSVTRIGSSAFSRCSGLTSVHITDLTAWCNISFSSNSSSNPLSYAHHLYLNGKEIIDLVIPDDITSIGVFAFYKCHGLTSVTIPNSVTSIGRYAFSNCDGLTSIKVETGNTTYDSRNDCNAIIETATNTLIAGCQNTIIPNSVTSIGDYAFYYCVGLTSATIPNSVTRIGGHAFYSCSGLISVTIPESVTCIDDYAFYGCSGLTSVHITDLTAWCNISFSSNSSSNPLYYAHHLYLNGKEIIDLVIPDDITSIGNYAFSGCSGLTSVTIPNSVTSIGRYAFCFCDGLTSIKVETGNTTYDSRNDCNAIIETATNTLIAGCQNTIIPNSVTSIGDYAFYYCVGLTSATIPNSVTSIGKAAFEGCTGLTSVTIPNSVTSIGKDAFEFCTGLTSITISESVTSIGNYAFSGCSGLTTVVVGMKTPLVIEKGTFSNRKEATLFVPIGSKSAYESADYWKEFKRIIEAECDWNNTIQFADAKVKAICAKNWDINGDGELCVGELSLVSNLGEVFTSNEEIKSFDELQYFTGLTEIGHSAFRDCSCLTSVIIPESVTSIEHSAFEDCNSLISVTMPESLITIGKDAFAGCVSLSSVIIPKSVTTIGEEAFAGCVSLSSITIPKSVTTIEGWTFAACTGIRSINVEAGNAYYDSRNNCNAIIETATNTLLTGCINTTIPEGITIIGGGAFCYLINLITITIPNSVTTIDEDAFAGCGLICAVIPNHVTFIGHETFSGCNNLSCVVIGSSVLSIEDYAFEDCGSLNNVYCYATEPPVAAYNYGWWGDRYSFDLSHIEDSTTLHVPESSLESYKSTAPWSYFKNIVPLTENDPNPNDNPDAIGGVKGTDDIIEEAYYDLQGHRLTAPQRGINIIRMSDGTTRKVMVK